MTPQIKHRIEQIRRGEVPEGYKKTKVGIVPIEWEINALSDISDEVKETIGKRQIETVSITAGIGFVNQAKKFGKELSGKQYEKYIVLQKGDFSYNKGNSKKYPQGCIYRLKNMEFAAVPNVFESFRIKSGSGTFYEQLFISGFLNSQLFSKINHGVRDDGLLNLTGKDFYESLLPSPPLSEQEKIAEVLETQDRVIELCEKKVEQLKKLKKLFLQKMFPKPGAAVPEWRFPGFTDAWEQRKLGEMGTTFTGLSGKAKEDFGHGDARFVTYMNVFTNPVSDPTRVEAVEIDKSQNVVQYGDVFFTTSSETPEEVGMSSVWLENTENTYLNSFCFGYRPTEKIDPHYMAYMLRSEAVRERIIYLAQGISRYNISKNGVMQIEVPLPNLAEQKLLGEYFCDLDNLITLHQRKCDEEKTKKKALMQLLLTGIVRAV